GPHERGPNPGKRAAAEGYSSCTCTFKECKKCDRNGCRPVYSCSGKRAATVEKRAAEEPHNCNGTPCGSAASGSAVRLSNPGVTLRPDQRGGN
ncbi:hypothetical protein PMAYCL1PPCAC_08743, partial [Pristionchus mayeri]